MGKIQTLYTGPFGLAIVLLHNVWVLDIPVIVTIVIELPRCRRCGRCAF